MRLLYVGKLEGVMDALDTFGLIDKPDVKVREMELTRWDPPDIEAPIWEFQFEKDGISLYSDGRLAVIIEGETIPEKDEVGSRKEARLRRGKSIDRTLEGQ